eukprot:5090994-Amphidinium_carterae.1
MSSLNVEMSRSEKKSLLVKKMLILPECAKRTIILATSASMKRNKVSTYLLHGHTQQFTTTVT